MANLYQIDQAIIDCVDAETGEIIDPEQLENLYMERTQKIEGVTLWIKNLESDALAYKAEKNAFAEREAAALKKAEQLKEWLAKALDGQKFSTGKCAVSFRRSERVEILDEGVVPKKYLTKTVTFKPDKTAIKELLKSGQKVRGCCLAEKYNAQIK